MSSFFSRRRYELAAVLVALVCVVLHLLSCLAPAIGLTKDGDESPLIRAIQLAEARVTDLKFRVRGQRPGHSDVVVVAIDEKSAQRFGLFPWPRERMGTALTKLAEQGVKAVGLDVAFTDEVVDEGKQLRELLEELKPGEAPRLRAEIQRRAAAPTGDQVLENGFRALGPRAVQGVIAFNESELKDFSREKADEFARLLAPQLIATVAGPGGSTRELPVDKLKALPAYLAQAPLPRFVVEGTHMGHFNQVPDVDGTVRRTPPLINLKGAKGLLPSMAFNSAAVALDAALVPEWNQEFNLTGVTFKPREGAPFTVPYEDNEPFVLINYDGPAEVFHTVSIADVIDGLPPQTLSGKVALIGLTLTGGSSSDQRVTPFKEHEPGIYTHAAMLSNLLERRFLERPRAAPQIEALAMLLLALALAFSIPRLKSFTLKAILIMGVLLAWGLAAQSAFTSGVLIASVMPTLSIVLESFTLVFLGYLSVDREKLKMRSTFSRYLGEEVMEEAIKNPEKLNKGEKREMTVLFSDIRGFTTLSERMLPEKLAAFINEYLSPMTRIVFEEKGTLDKYIGDAIMAFWNAPLEQPDHALRTCRAAISMLEKLDELKVKWRAENYPEFDIGVGINTGPMIVGNMGSDVRVDYTVMGDAVNLASRLEGTNKEYETRIIIGEGTYPHVKDQVICRRLGAVRVKGKRKPVRIYELRGIGQPKGEEATAITQFEQGLDAYGEQRWEDAERLFTEVLKVWPNDPPSRRYISEIADLRANPPGAGWDGVYTATTK